MIKKTIATSIFFLAVVYAGAQEIIIEKANVISSGDKSTLAIEYSGAGRIQFFAVNDAGSLTVDFPGVLSNVDFSALDINHVAKIEQSALDPDSNRGVSLRFDLQDAVSYQFFDGEKGSVILLFEGSLAGGPYESNAAVETEVISPEVQVVQDLPAAPQNFSSLVLQGRDTAQYLRSVSTVQQGDQVQVIADVPEMDSYKYFYLTQPDRYVIDFYGVFCDLEQDQVELMNAAVSRIRVKQFQVHPTPITRMVLDLAQPLEIRLEQSTDHSLVLATNDFMVQTPTLAVTEEIPSEPAAHEIVTSEPIVAESVNTDSVEPAPLETSPVEQVVTNEVSSQELEVSSSSIKRSSSETPEQADIAEDNSEVVKQEIAVVKTPPVESSPETRVETIESELPSFEETVVAEPTIMEATAVESTKVFDDSVVPAKKTGILPFVVADEVDQELNSFINAEKSFYTEMKDVPALKPRNNHILVTNQAISKSIGLSESNALQTEDALQSEFEKSSLFQETDNFETDRISGGEETYKGFEIQGIDVVDVNVTDLLRFFADQVGFNLYVDPSVKDLKATYKFANIPWDQAMDIILRNAGLDYQYDNGVLRVATTQKFKDEAAARRALLEEQALSVPPETVTFHLSYAKASEVAPIVTEYLSPRGSLLQDERTNTLIIEDIPKKMVAIRSLIKKLDTQVPQVTIESRIVETTKRFMRELGIQWGVSGIYAPEYGTQTGVTFPNRVTVGGPRLGSSVNGIEGGYAVNFPVIAESPSGFGLSLGNILDTFKLDISLQLLESEGLGQIISAPKVTTQNNKTAIIQNGQKIPVQTIQRGTITVRYINAVLELEVTPHITSEKTIIMDLIVDKSEPDFTREVLGNPIINIRRAETRVLVKDGGTAVIGGIYVLNEQDSSQGIPGLKQMPVIRRLFGSERKEIANQELLIFVTPRIVKY